jgi:hypothetical protein
MDLSLLDTQPLFRPPFDRDDLKRFNQRHIQAVGPDHRFAALVDMLVPGPLGRANEIAGLHDHLLAFDVGVGSLTLKHETKSRHRMAVCGGDFSGLDELKAEKHRVRGQFSVVETRVDEPDVSSFGGPALDADHIARAQQAIVNIVPLP